jgi:cyclopropane fatty-acyl-phospholipid synthase-like methyltransferase
VDEALNTAKPELVEGPDGAVKYYKRDFWSEENRRFAKPHFRLEKAARIVNKIAGDAEVDLLDVGCGPATLSRFVSPAVNYYGIDMAIHDPAPNLLEADLVKSPVRFGDRRFDIVVAQGFFEYMGTCQEQKFTEISDVLRDRGTFIATYVNFDHREHQVYWPYSNVQPLAEFRASLSKHFRIERSFPTSYNWNHSEPNRQFMRVSQLPIMFSIPLISKVLGVEYFFICSKRPTRSS